MRKRPNPHARRLAVAEPIRALERAAAVHTEQCFTDAGACPHGTPVPVMPRGVVPIVVRPLRGAGTRVVLIRYRRGDYSSCWHVVRADNGRRLGALYRETDGRGWTAHASADALRGDDVDDAGNILDRVPAYVADPARPVACGERTREDAATRIVWRLDERGAPAVGYERHPDVTIWHSRARQHFELSAGLCTCGEATPCRRGAALN